MADPICASGWRIYSLRALATLRLAAVGRDRGFLVTVALTVAALLIPIAEAQTLAPGDLDSARNYYLNDLITLPRYTPGKNSFLVQHLHRGDRKTLLDLSGTGSVRHIWSTWSIPGDDSDTPAPGRVLVRVFLDGESKAAISGTLDELSRAAEATANRFIPLPAFNYKGAFNIYLPIFFARGIRLEIEAADEIAEFYAQIDYRTEGLTQRSPRLVSQKNGDRLTLQYLGDMETLHSTVRANGRITQQSVSLEYSPAENAGEFVIAGPGSFAS